MLRHRMRRQPEAFRLVRVGRGLIGMDAFVVLSELHDDRAIDPGVTAVCRHALESDRFGPGHLSRPNEGSGLDREPRGRLETSKPGQPCDGQRLRTVPTPHWST